MGAENVVSCPIKWATDYFLSDTECVAREGVYSRDKETKGEWRLLRNEHLHSPWEHEILNPTPKSEQKRERERKTRNINKEKGETWTEQHPVVVVEEKEKENPVGLCYLSWTILCLNHMSNFDFAISVIALRREQSRTRDDLARFGG